MPNTSLGRQNASNARNTAENTVQEPSKPQAPLHSTQAPGVQMHKWDGRVEEISWTPRAFVLKGFLGEHEVLHLIEKARPTMTKSVVLDSVTGESQDSEVRTSTGTFFALNEDTIIMEIERRIARVTQLPQLNGEGLQILHYVGGQKYEPHHDFFHDSVNQAPELGGQRVATILMYLTTPEEGGETVFPAAPLEMRVSGPQWSACARQGLAVKPRRGDALLFYSLQPNGELDESSLHGSCPVTKGEKWSATKWIHVGAFGGNEKQAKAKWGNCLDVDKRCAAWASQGECAANPGYMRKSCCRACEALAAA
ncbi:hypothetical protein WJX81_001827 [Elliptochloris bilobata]|uniref:procollagen-proline 4-dioxygenase n=1 Tax=Elliptochloris bilobata TaxID=381761 RepID=A0AAW1RUM2_9CHLO